MPPGQPIFPPPPSSLTIVSTCIEVDTYMSVTKPLRTRRTHSEEFKRSPTKPV